MVLICGAEDKGISPGLTKVIDNLCIFPLLETSSLNVSVVTGIILSNLKI